MQNVTNPLMSGFVEETPLAHACACGYLDMVKLLISHKANVNYKCSVSCSSTTDNSIFYPTFCTQDSVPPIAFAIILKQNFIVKYLLDHCDELNTSFSGLIAPIDISVKVENFECTRMMVDKLGGLESALQLASAHGLVQLEHHIRIFAAFSESVSSYLC